LRLRGAEGHRRQRQGGHTRCFDKCLHIKFLFNFLSSSTSLDRLNSFNIQYGMLFRILQKTRRKLSPSRFRVVFGCFWAIFVP
jgi:hypothetical protein